MRLLALLLAMVAGQRAHATPAGSVDRRESLAEVASVLTRLRSPAIQREAATGEPRRIYVVVDALTPERHAALEAAGLAIELPAAGLPGLPWRGGELVQGLASPEAERAIAGLAFVRAIRSPGRAWTNAGSTSTVGDTILLGAVARAVLGTEGTGIAVGVISDGADDRAASALSGDLPPTIEMPPIAGLEPGDGDEGTAMLEIVHDMAPGARLLFAAPRTSAEMVAAIDGLAAAGAQVIVDDLVFTDEPKFEDGPIAIAARRFTTGGGAYVTAAGNFARAHYFATYRPGRGRTFAGVGYRALHVFQGGDFGNSLRLAPGAELFVSLQWNDRFGRAASDFDLVLARPGGGADAVLAASADPQSGSDDPLEALRYVNRTGAAIDAYLAIAEFGRITDPARLRLNLLVFSRAVVPLQYLVRRESVFGHAAVEEVVATAAADALRPDVIEDFSSSGPATIFFPERAVRQVPRLTAVDAVDTAVGLRGRFSNPFRGTSAAAPHVAGCAALLMAAGTPAATAVSAMLSTALDLDELGFDLTAGAGRLDCGAAARLLSGNATAPAIDGLAAGFDPSGGIAVQASGADPDADVRSATVRFLDRAGGELARSSDRVAVSGTGFGLALMFRAPELVSARMVAVQVTDATGLASPTVDAVLVCPRDDSLGDALCALGDLLDRLSAVAGRRGDRLERTARAVASALTRAGKASTAGQPAGARRALRSAGARLGRILESARAARLAPDLQGIILEDVRGLRLRIRVLRTSFT